MDDEKAMIDAVQPLLERLGYEVTSETSSVEALKAFQQNQNSFDLIITDMTMPGITGVDLAREIAKIRSDIPIILCTGHSEIVDESKAKSLGISAFAMKPVVASDLAKIVRQVLEK